MRTAAPECSLARFPAVRFSTFPIIYLLKFAVHLFACLLLVGMRASVSRRFSGTCHLGFCECTCAEGDCEVRQ